MRWGGASDGTWSDFAHASLSAPLVMFTMSRESDSVLHRFGKLTASGVESGEWDEPWLHSAVPMGADHGRSEGPVKQADRRSVTPRGG